MKREDMDELLRVVEKETVRVRSLGGYSTEATSIMVLWEVLLKITRHLDEAMPRSKKNDNRD